MRTLRKGLKGKDVERWQMFLRSFGMYMSVVDGDFGPQTHKATQKYQRVSGLVSDGVVGNYTFANAVGDGFEIVKPDPEDLGKKGPHWPPKPSFRTPSLVQRQKMLGTFRYSPKPTKSNPEGIQIHGTWVKDNIVKLKVPAIAGLPGATKTGLVWFHEAGVPQLLALFKAWEAAGLTDLIKSYGGSWEPRFIRGSRTTLSNHAFGSAFDINVPSNYLGTQPALVGEMGSVRKLVPLANEFGFYWGGHYPNRPDGMHFELAKLIKI